MVKNNSAILGGGIGVYGGSPAIVDNLITGNVALTFGGGLFMSSTAAAVISGNRIERNNWPKYGLDGGGAAIDGQDLLFQDNVITQNGILGSSNGEGAAGLLISPSTGMRVVDNLVADNVGLDGVAIVGGYRYQSFQVTGLTVVDNAGTGLFLGDDYGRVTIKDTVIAGSSKPVDCGFLGSADDSGPAAFVDDDVAGGPVDAVCGTFSAAAGDLSATPTFDAGYVPAAGSALVDAGAADPALPPTDLAGNLRNIDGNRDGVAVTDIGAYERQ